MITPVAFENIKNHTYTIFAIINAIMVPSVYFFFPETAYRSLEEMDTIFHKVSGAKGYFDVVHVAAKEPRRYGKNGELLISYDETDEHKAHVGVGAHHEDRSSSSEAENGRGRGGVLQSS
jgi:hypothetical protein